jgi:hypothetical protein
MPVRARRRAPHLLELGWCASLVAGYLYPLHVITLRQVCSGLRSAKAAWTTLDIRLYVRRWSLSVLVGLACPLGLQLLACHTSVSHAWFVTSPTLCRPDPGQLQSRQDRPGGRGLSAGKTLRGAPVVCPPAGRRGRAVLVLRLAHGAAAAARPARLQVQVLSAFSGRVLPAPRGSLEPPEALAARDWHASCAARTARPCGKGSTDMPWRARSCIA